MNVSLTPELEKIVNKKVKSGMYNSASEVVREALRLLDEQDRMRAIKLDALRHEIQAGLNSGESVPLNVEAIKTEAEGVTKNAKHGDAKSCHQAARKDGPIQHLELSLSGLNQKVLRSSNSTFLL